MHRFVLALVVLVSGCPSSTTLETDGGPGVDAFAAVDAPSTTDAGASWSTCARTSECELVHTGCCAGCSTPTAASFDGVNRMDETEHFMDVCPMPTPCPGCAVAANANIVVTCASATCTVEDVSMLPLSACNADSDCMLRYASCCACSGTPDEVIAIRSDAESAIQALLCDPGGCAADCVQMRPTGTAVCDVTTGHCRIPPTH